MNAFKATIPLHVSFEDDGVGVVFSYFSAVGFTATFTGTDRDRWKSFDNGFGSESGGNSKGGADSPQLFGGIGFEIAFGRFHGFPLSFGISGRR
jgi:hypothetical protein